MIIQPVTLKAAAISAITKLFKLMRSRIYAVPLTGLFISGSVVLISRHEAQWSCIAACLTCITSMVAPADA